MPAFSLGQTTASVDPIRLVSNQRRADGIDNLSPHEKVAGRLFGDVDDFLEEDEQKREPHRGTEVVLYVTEAVEQLLMPWQARHNHHRSIHDSAAAGRLPDLHTQ